jgi:hypothetical protein
MTVLAGLLGLKESDWDRPLTDFEPVLAEYIKNAAGQTPTYNVQWENVTPRALAAQIAGVPRDGFPAPNELILQAARQASHSAPISRKWASHLSTQATR